MNYALRYKADGNSKHFKEIYCFLIKSMLVCTYRKLCLMIFKDISSDDVFKAQLESRAALLIAAEGKYE